MLTDKELAGLVQAARLYYEDGLTQAQVAAKIGVSRPQVSKMLAHAREAGIVHIEIRPPVAGDAELLKLLQQRFGIKGGIVLPQAQREALLRETSEYLAGELRYEKNIGLGWGYTLGEIAGKMASAGGLKGSGNIVTRTIEAPAFDRIDAARAVKVVITDKTSGKITIAADDNVMDYVVVEANGGRLTATIDKSINNLSNADVTVTVPANGSIRALDASSAAKISGDVVLNADKFAMDASSAAKIDVSVKAQSCAVAASSASKINASVEAVSCSVEASSASKITLKGSAAKCTADLSSAAKLSAGDFVAAECSVNTSSAAKAVVNCTERLHADASSGSSIRYSGDCQTSINKSSGGSVGRN